MAIRVGIFGKYLIGRGDQFAFTPKSSLRKHSTENPRAVQFGADLLRYNVSKRLSGYLIGL